MNSDLPATGTVALLELLDPLVPDDFINQVWPHGRTGGRRHAHTAAQLFRVHLLSLLSPVHSLNLLVKMLPEQRAWRTAPPKPGARCADAARVSGAAGRGRVAADQLASAPAPGGGVCLAAMVGRLDRRHGFARRLRGLQKKSTGQYSARRAALGGRTLKTGQSRCFVGYKKHTLRLWLHDYTVGVQLVPLVSWVTPANVSEGGLLAPSLHYCHRQWDWCPPLVVADMGYLATAAKRQCRERWQVAVLTKLRSDMKLVAPYGAWNQAACPQGEPLAWLGYDGRAGEHWFGAAAQPQLCGQCWEATRCPRQFAYRPGTARDVAGALALGQSGGAASIAAGPSLD